MTKNQKNEKIKKKLAKKRKNSINKPNSIFAKLPEYVIIQMMVHYSSAYTYYEGGAKNPLKGTSLKFLALARNASFACGQGVKNLG